MKLPYWLIHYTESIGMNKNSVNDCVNDWAFFFNIKGETAMKIKIIPIEWDSKGHSIGEILLIF